MSLRGNLNKVRTDFAKSVRNTARNGMVDSKGSAWGTQKIVGYVCNVHGQDDENEELRGTVDVQEWDYEIGEDKLEGAGWHEGVKVSAIQNNKSGVFLMPSLYSDVVIVQDPFSLEEYVLMCSHVDVIQMQSHQSIKLGVVETKEFDEDDDDSPDYDELEETGNASTTEYDKDKVVQIVKTKDGEVVITQNATSVEVNAKDSVVIINTDGSITVQSKSVDIKADDSVTIKTKNVDVKADSSASITSQTTEVKEGQFIRKGTSNVDGAGGFCGIPVCPFTGAVHTGSIITA